MKKGIRRGAWAISVFWAHAPRDIRLADGGEIRDPDEPLFDVGHSRQAVRVLQRAIDVLAELSLLPLRAIGPGPDGRTFWRQPDLHENRGFDSLRVVRKGGRKEALAINPQTAQRIKSYLLVSGHGHDMSGPLFQPLKHNGKQQEARRAMDPDAIDRVVRKYAKRLGLERGYSAHSMRATFITTALKNGASLEDVQKAAGHRDPSTTKLYDRRGYNPEKSASFFATDVPPEI